jgi:hypothetical protein
MATNVCSADAVSFYVLNPTSLVKPSALQQLAIELAQFNIGRDFVKTPELKPWRF